MRSIKLGWTNCEVTEGLDVKCTCHSLQEIRKWSARCATFSLMSCSHEHLVDM